MNVVSPVRWLHSPVIDRIAMMGSTIVIGKPIAAANVLWVSSSSGAKRIVPTVASDAHDHEAGHQPEPGAGVEHLAQLDADDASQDDPPHVHVPLAGACEDGG